MGIGPWAQADLVRDTERAERARFRRIVKREIDFITNNYEPGARPSRMHVLAALERIRSSITPPKPKASPKFIAGDDDEFMGHPI